MTGWNGEEATPGEWSSINPHQRPQPRLPPTTHKLSAACRDDRLRSAAVATSVSMVHVVCAVASATDAGLRCFRGIAGGTTLQSKSVTLAHPHHMRYNGRCSTIPGWMETRVLGRNLVLDTSHHVIVPASLFRREGQLLLEPLDIPCSALHYSHRLIFKSSPVHLHKLDPVQPRHPVCLGTFPTIPCEQIGLYVLESL